MKDESTNNQPESIFFLSEVMNDKGPPQRQKNRKALRPCHTKKIR